ncbi:MAG: hypothetical protein RLW61_07480 [Gammaproteobacteria bacterium]
MLALCLLGPPSVASLADDVLAELELVQVLPLSAPVEALGGEAILTLLNNQDDTLLLYVSGPNQQRGCFLYEGGSYTAVAVSGQMLPGAPGPLVDTSVSGMISATSVVFRATFADGGSAVYRYDRGSGNHTLVAASGAAVPGGSGTFSHFFSLAADGDRVMFVGVADDGGRGIYRWDGALTRLADYATAVPGGAGTFSFLGFAAARDDIVAFRGRDATGADGIFRSDGGGPLTRVADTTTTVPGTAVTFDHLEVAGIHDGIVFFRGFGGVVAGVYGGAQAAIILADTRRAMPGALGPFDCCFGIVHRSAPGVYYFQGTDWVTSGIYLARDNAHYKVIDSDAPLDGIYSGFLQPGGGVSGVHSTNGRVYFEASTGIYAARPVFAPAPAPAPRTTLGFEDLGLVEGAPVTSVPGVAGLTLDGARLVQPAAPDTAFPGDDAGTGAMLTAADADGATLSIIFDAPVRDVTLDIANLFTGWPEPWVTLRAYDATSGGALLETIRAVRTDMPGGPAGVMATVDFSFGFAGLDRIRRIEIRGPVGATLPAFAIDNLSFASEGSGGGEAAAHEQVPVPPWATLAGLLALGLSGWRHRRRAAGETRGVRGSAQSTTTRVTTRQSGVPTSTYQGPAARAAGRAR